MTDRVRCLVPFCRRTTKPGRNGVNVQWICGNHWKAVPLAQRRVWGRLRRQWRRYGPEAGVHFDARWWRVWDRLKRSAIEAAGGIG
ncbi:hypothetical protein [Bradyrhizobium sp. 2S1]|uniref:hypothetical protein n=1 Tax=Bradyrhizobium sp. 2S1 TaxID=1404429 RepID=UPI0014074B83|nr:hypothetical protein [Bradyrhizobium sp. 2S1]MCK7671486.1 hypothetical protein [Bradyrhizobium sp. 2S1]